MPLRIWEVKCHVSPLWNHKLVLQTLQNNQRNRFITKPLHFRTPTWTFDPQNAGSQRKFRYASTMVLFGCPGSHLLGACSWLETMDARDLYHKSQVTKNLWSWKKQILLESATIFPWCIFIVYLPWKIISGMLPLITWTSPKALFLWRRLQWIFLPLKMSELEVRING